MLAPQGEAALREVLRQTLRSGASRRAVMLHGNKLPLDLTRPHHLRLARDALSGLAAADRAQVFELANARFAIVWRGRGDDEIEQARQALDHLLSGQPNQHGRVSNELLTLYDLPSQANWLLDEISQPSVPARPTGPGLPLDVPRLARLEAALEHADLSCFARWRPIMGLTYSSPVLAWEERFFATYDIAAALCPDIAMKSEPWLFRRLTRTLDRRMLALLASPHELQGCGKFAINLNVETILSDDFLRFDEALPLPLRGNVILNLRAADIFLDMSGFIFARQFAKARGYSLLLAGASAALPYVFDSEDAGLDYIQLAYSAVLPEDPGLEARLSKSSGKIILTGLDRPSCLQWAISKGFVLGRGRALSG